MATTAVDPRCSASATLILRRRREEAEAAKATGPVAKVTDSFGEWLKENNPGIVMGHPEWRWDYLHTVAMQGLLDRVTVGLCKRAKFQIPIRHVKSQHNTVAYTVYRLDRNPRIRILIVSYDQDQANEFGLASKRFAEDRGMRLSRDKNAISDWETVDGGRVKSSGIGAGFASKGFDLIIIDDPIGRREDAESAAYRKMVWNTITNDILARCEPETAVIFTMSRWNKDDPAARIDTQLESDLPGLAWETLDLPGEALGDDEFGNPQPDPLGRKPGEPLWPEHRGKQWLAQKKIELLDYGFASLIQGRPRAQMGGIFKWDEWKLLDFWPKGGKLLRYWDLAGTKKRTDAHDPDFTAGVLTRLKDDLFSIAHVRRFQCEIGERDARMVEQAQADVKKYGQGVVYWFESQTGPGGYEATQKLARALRKTGVAVFFEAASKDKLTRATPLASACKAGDVYLEPEDESDRWHNAFRIEAADFTGNGETHDDQVDGAAGSYNKQMKLNDPTKAKGRGAYNWEGATKL